MTLSHHTNLNTILLLIFCFVDDFIKEVLGNIKYALTRPNHNTPPIKKHNLSIAEIVTLFAAVRANMKKIMTEAQHHLFDLRQKVEVVFSVLKLRFGLETSLPRSGLGHLAHYLWCITAYQLKMFFELMDKSEKNTDVKGLLA